MDNLFTLNINDKWIYTAPPKTASSSIRVALKESLYVPNIKELHKKIPLPNHQPLSTFNKNIEGFGEWFTFGSVRNPYDRIVSLWLERGDGIFFDVFVKSISNTSDYCLHCPKELKLQQDWFIDETMIIKFENLNKDFQKVCDKLGIKCGLPHIRKSENRKHFSQYYNEETQKHIYNTFKEDFIKYNYSYDLV